MSRQIYYDWEGNEVDPLEAEEVKPTNADRIRVMSDEELTELFWIRADCELCPCRSDSCSDDCKGAWLEWLRQDAEV